MGHGHHAGRASQPNYARRRLYAVLGIAAIVGFFWIKSALTPAVDNAAFTENCMTAEGYDRACKGRRAVLNGEIEGDDDQWRLLIGGETLNVELEPGKAAIVEGQQVEIAGRLERGGLLNQEEVRPARIVRTLSSREEGMRTVASRNARREAEELRVQCVGRGDPDLIAMGGGGRCRGSGPYALNDTASCLEGLYALERRCRAAGY